MVIHAAMCTYVIAGGFSVGFPCNFCIMHVSYDVFLVPGHYCHHDIATWSLNTIPMSLFMQL